MTKESEGIIETLQSLIAQVEEHGATNFAAVLHVSPNPERGPIRIIEHTTEGMLEDLEQMVSMTKRLRLADERAKEAGFSSHWEMTRNQHEQSKSSCDQPAS